MVLQYMILIFINFPIFVYDIFREWSSYTEKNVWINTEIILWLKPTRILIQIINIQNILNKPTRILVRI